MGTPREAILENAADSYWFEPYYFERSKQRRFSIGDRGLRTTRENYSTQYRRRHSSPTDRPSYSGPWPPRTIYQRLDETRREFRILRLQPGTHGILEGVLETRVMPFTRTLLLYNHLKAARKRRPGSRAELSQLLAYWCESSVDIGAAMRSDLGNRHGVWLTIQLDAFYGMSRMLAEAAHAIMVTQSLTEDDYSQPELMRNLTQLETWLRTMRTIRAPLSAAKYFPRYESISYCWHTTGAATTMRLDGHHIQVPASAADVLERFRDSEEARHVWIDAICINQQDSGEKPHQIKMMGDIYRLSERTLTWLGNYDESLTRDAIAFWRSNWKLFAPYETVDYRLYILGDGTVYHDCFELEPETDHGLSGTFVMHHPLTAKVCQKLSDHVIKWCLSLLHDPDKADDDITEAEELSKAESIEILQREQTLRLDTPSLCTPDQDYTGLEEVEESLRCLNYLQILDHPDRGIDVKDTLESLCHIVQRRWFSRMWTFQESCNSSNMFYFIGTDFLEARSLDALAAFLENPGHWSESLQLDSYSAGRIALLNARLRTDTSPRVDRPLTLLWSLAMGSRSLACSDPRDKIFALISMSTWVMKGQPTPPGLLDYKQPVEDCMCRATKAMLQEGCSLDVLMDRAGIKCGYQSVSISNGVAWPSWCPRWHEVFDASKDAFRMWNMVPEPSAASDVDYDLSLLERAESPRHLLVEAIVLGTVNFCLQDNFYLDVHNLMADASPEIGLASVASILLTGQMTLEETYEGMGSCRAVNPDNTIAEDFQDCMGSKGFSTIVGLHGKDRRLFQDRKGIVWLGPEGTSPGDLVVLLCGASVPFVVKKQGDHYLLIGYCYGPALVMSGRYFKLNKEKQYRKGFLLSLC